MAEPIADPRDVAFAALLNWRMEDRVTGTATDDATLVLRDVADRLGAPEGRPLLTLRQALSVYADDAVPCDDPGCRDGTAPVCDPQSLGCQLRRLALRPDDVHELIAAEHQVSGYDPDTV